MVDNVGNHGQDQIAGRGRAQTLEGHADGDRHDIAAAQTASVQTAISVSYIWVETVCYIIGAVILILFWTVEKNLPEEQKAIKERSKK